MWMHLWHSSILHVNPMDTLFPSLPQVQWFDQYSRNAVLGEFRVTLSELKASQSLFLCEELQKTTKVITLSHGLALCAHTVARELHVNTAVPSFYS